MPPLHRAHPAVDVSQAGGRAVLFNQATGNATVLNPTGTFLWSQLSRPVTTDDLAAALRQAYPHLDEATARTDTEKFLSSLAGSGLLVVESAPASDS